MNTRMFRWVMVAALFGLLIGTAPAVQAALVRDWEFDDGSGTTAIDTTANQNGTLTNFDFDANSGWTTGPFGDGALLFDGINDYVSVGSNTLGSSYTIAGWIRGDTWSSSEKVIFSQYSSASGRTFFEVRDSGKLGVFEGGSGGAGHVTSTITLNDDQWYYVALTNNEKSVTGYIDGNRAFSTTFARSAPSVNNYIGAYMDGGSPAGGFDGTINNLKIYDSALSQLEVRALQVTPSVRKWALNDSNTTGTTAADTSGNGVNGTLVNFNNNADSGWGGVRSLHFDGVDDYVSASSNALGSTYTIAAWIKGDTFASSGENIIFSQYNTTAGRFLFEVRDGTLSAFSGGGGGYSSVLAQGSKLDPNKWYFVALTTDADKSVTGYLNAAQDFSTSFYHNAPNANNYIGAAVDSGGPFGNFDGYIEGVNVYGFAMTTAQLQQLFAPTAYRQYAMQGTGSSNTAVDAQGNQNGTLVNFNHDANSGWTGRALKFDGIDDAVSAGSGGLGSAYTVSGWIKGDSFAASGENIIFSQYNTAAGRFFFEVRDGKLSVFSGGYGVAQGSTLDPDQWYHVAVTNDGKKVVVYLDGQRDFSATFSSDAPNASNVIGAYYDPGSGTYGGFFDGLMNNVRVYDLALTEGQIYNLFTALDKGYVTLTGSVGNTNLLLGGKTAVSATIGSADGGGVDLIDWTGGGALTGQNGQLAAGGSTTLDGYYVGSAYGNANVTASVSAVNHILGGAADNSGTSIQGQVNVGIATTVGAGNYTGATVLSGLVEANDDLVGLASKTLQDGDVLGTEAIIRAGLAAAEGTVTMQWRTRTTGDIDSLIASDVLNLSSMTADSAFVLQMSYDPTVSWISDDENALAAAGAIYLVSSSGSLWENTVLQNSGAGDSLVTNYQGTWDSFLSAGQPGEGKTLAQLLGSWGVDATGHTVWAVINHNSEFAVVPEPGTLALLAAGLLGLLVYAWRKR